MERILAVCLAALATACLQPVPADAVSMDSDPAVQAIRAEWVKAGLPNVESCAAPLWLEVSADEFAELCKHPSCAAPDAGLNCAGACTRWFSNKAVAIWDGEHKGDAATHYRISKAVARAHETLHTFETCAYDDADEPHARADVWALLPLTSR